MHVDLNFIILIFQFDDYDGQTYFHPPSLKSILFFMLLHISTSVIHMISSTTYTLHCQIAVYLCILFYSPLFCLNLAFESIFHCFPSTP